LPLAEHGVDGIDAAATSNAVPESVDTERSRAASAASSGHAASVIVIFSLPGMCRAIAVISSGR
jgi:hypothetical protein